MKGLEKVRKDCSVHILVNKQLSIILPDSHEEIYTNEILNSLEVFTSASSNEKIKTKMTHNPTETHLNLSPRKEKFRMRHCRKSIFYSVTLNDFSSPKILPLTKKLSLIVEEFPQIINKTTYKNIKRIGKVQNNSLIISRVIKEKYSTARNDYQANHSQ